MKRIMIAGTGSGCGKTTVVCALLQALVDRKIKTASFKCGPDYIDPMFHRKVIGAESYNLDSFFCDENTLRYLLKKGSREMSVIEGVMGFYDGLNGRGSSYEVSRITNTPVVIVINARGMSESIGAIIKGFLEYRQPNNIVGFIFNRLAESRVLFVKKLCDELGTEFLGYLPADSEFVVESRHLGLVTADEITDMKMRLEKLAAAAEKYICLHRICELSESPELSYIPPVFEKNHRVKVALSRDEAFCFFYPENVQILEAMGAEVIPFSPLRDKRLPENIDGIILCGGYPELYADMISGNSAMLTSVKNAVESGIPCIGECGGFMYLHDEFEDIVGVAHKGAGVIHGKAFKTPRLKNFGYSIITAERDNLLCGRGDSFPVHEFHYFDSTCCGNDFTAVKPGKDESRKCVNADMKLWTGFPHLYFYSRPELAENFLAACERFEKNG